MVLENSDKYTANSPKSSALSISVKNSSYQLRNSVALKTGFNDKFYEENYKAKNNKKVAQKRKSVNYKVSYTPKQIDASILDFGHTSQMVRKTEWKNKNEDSATRIRRSRKLRTMVKLNPKVEHEEDEYEGRSSTIPFDVNEESYNQQLQDTQRVSRVNAALNVELIGELDNLKHKLKNIFRSLSKVREEDENYN